MTHPSYIDAPLPKGVADFLPEKADKIGYIEAKLRRVFELWGFSRIITPLLEFHDVLALGTGEALMEKAFQTCVGEVADQGAAVLLSSHILAEVEKLCGNVTIIRSGRAVKSGTLDELRHLMRTTVKVRTHSDGQKLQSTPFVHDFSIDDGHYVFSVDRNDLDRAMALLTDLGIIDLTVTPASLEDMFLREYQGADR